MSVFTSAPEAERIAATLIPRHHPELIDKPIRYVFRDRATRSRGKLVLGKARKVTNLNAYLAGTTLETTVIDEEPAPFFVIELARDAWELLQADQREALVDHELCHCTTSFNENSGDERLTMRPHDLEEFTQVVERHGLWRPDLVEFTAAVDAARQREQQ